MLLIHHVDEVDDDEPPEVAQPELAGDLLRRFHVRLEGGLLDVPFAGAPTRVHVDGDHRLGWVDDKVSAGFQLHTILVDDPDLILQLVFVEKRVFLLGQFDDFYVAGGDGFAIGPHLPEGLHVVDQNLLDVRRKVVPKRPDAEGAFLVDQRRRRGLRGPFLDLLPESGEMLVVAGQLLLGPVHPGRPHDESEPVFGRDLFDKLLKPFPVALVLDFPGDAAALLVRKEDKVPSRKRDVSGQERAFALAHFAEDLDEDRLSRL